MEPLIAAVLLLPAPAVPAVDPPAPLVVVDEPAPPAAPDALPPVAPDALEADPVVEPALVLGLPLAIRAFVNV